MRLVGQGGTVGNIFAVTSSHSSIPFSHAPLSSVKMVLDGDELLELPYIGERLKKSSAATPTARGMLPSCRIWLDQRVGKQERLVGWFPTIVISIMVSSLCSAMFTVRLRHFGIGTLGCVRFRVERCLRVVSDGDFVPLTDKEVVLLFTASLRS